MSKRKKSGGAPASPRGGEHAIADNGSVTTRVVVPPDLLQQATGEGGAEHVPAESGESGESADIAQESREGERIETTTEVEAMPESAGVPVDAEGFENDAESEAFDAEMTVNLVGELPLPGRDDLDEPTATTASETLADVDGVMLQRKHLRGLLEALVFASDSPITPKELAKLASAPQKQVKELLAELKSDYASRGMHLDEVAGGWVFRTSPQYAPFVRDLTKQKPVRLTRAQVETLAIIAYRQPITRPQIEAVRGVNSAGPVRTLLEKGLVRTAGRDKGPGRAFVFVTTREFLSLFGLAGLEDLPPLSDDAAETLAASLAHGQQEGEPAAEEEAPFEFEA